MPPPPRTNPWRGRASPTATLVAQCVQQQGGRSGHAHVGIGLSAIGLAGFLNLVCQLGLDLGRVRHRGQQAATALRRDRPPARAYKFQLQLGCTGGQTGCRSQVVANLRALVGRTTARLAQRACGRLARDSPGPCPNRQRRRRRRRRWQRGPRIAVPGRVACWCRRRRGYRWLACGRRRGHGRGRQGRHLGQGHVARIHRRMQCGRRHRGQGGRRSQKRQFAGSIGGRECRCRSRSRSRCRCGARRRRRQGWQGKRQIAGHQRAVWRQWHRRRLRHRWERARRQRRRCRRWGRRRCGQRQFRRRHGHGLWRQHGWRRRQQPHGRCGGGRHQRACFKRWGRIGGRQLGRDWRGSVHALGWRQVARLRLPGAQLGCASFAVGLRQVSRRTHGTSPATLCGRAFRAAVGVGGHGGAVPASRVAAGQANIDGAPHPLAGFSRAAGRVAEHHNHQDMQQHGQREAARQDWTARRFRRQRVQFGQRRQQGVHSGGLARLNSGPP